MTTLVALLSILLQIVGVVLLADFVSGILHWLEDTYGSEKTPLLGRIVVKPNVIHHHQPREFTKSPFWRRNSVTMILAAIILALGTAFLGASWQLYLFCALAAVSNEMHCWTHRSPEENGWFINLLHRCRILQTPAHHAVHHTDPKNRAYCVLTNYVNPLLDRMEFWRRAEIVIFHIFHIRPRPDSSIKKVQNLASTAIPQHPQFISHPSAPTKRRRSHDHSARIRCGSQTPGATTRLHAADHDCRVRAGAPG